MDLIDVEKGWISQEDLCMRNIVASQILGKHTSEQFHWQCKIDEKLPLDVAARSEWTQCTLKICAMMPDNSIDLNNLNLLVHLSSVAGHVVEDMRVGQYAEIRALMIRPEWSVFQDPDGHLRMQVEHRFTYCVKSAKPSFPSIPKWRFDPTAKIPFTPEICAKM